MASSLSGKKACVPPEYWRLASVLRPSFAFEYHLRLQKCPCEGAGRLAIVNSRHSAPKFRSTLYVDGRTAYFYYSCFIFPLVSSIGLLHQCEYREKKNVVMMTYQGRLAGSRVGTSGIIAAPVSYRIFVKRFHTRQADQILVSSSKTQ